MYTERCRKKKKLISIRAQLISDIYQQYSRLDADNTSFFMIKKKNKYIYLPMKDPVYGPIYKNCFSTFSYFYLYLHLFALVDMARCVCWQNDCLSFYLSCFFFISFETSYKCLSIYFSSYVFHLFYSALKFFKI